ncbi:hypothetical protein [Nocardia sp. NPDC020380]|uniref:hypothetical protein n=1 Tax=Nocardia sp. NPDC020380 TaxID=3364309 RepID=UPI00379EA423
MRIISIAAAPAAALMLTVAVAGTAHAGDSSGNTDHPGSCLVVQNHTGKNVHLTLNYPTESGYWDYAPDEDATVLSDESNNAITSPSGNWDVQTKPDVSDAWVYDASDSTDRGCAGSWILTMNP